MRNNFGFTLLEIMIAIAIMSLVIVSALSIVNYNLSVVSREITDAELSILGRNKLAEMELDSFKEKEGSGDFSPNRPDVTWKSELGESSYIYLQKIIIKVKQNDREVVLERYILK